VRILATLILLLLLSICIPLKSLAQSSEALPADLIFSTGLSTTSQAELLVRVNARTSEITPFYIADGVSINALRWSPQGHFLAILEIPVQGEPHICILKRDGILHVCFDRGVSQYAFSDLSENYPLTWSNDEQRVYFLVEDQRVFSLVEADISTGQIARTVYQMPAPYTEAPPLIYWSSSLDYIAVYHLNMPYVSDYADIIETRRVSLIDLHTNQQVELDNFDADLGYLFFCRGFSPSGNYLAARVYSDPGLAAYSVTEPRLSTLAILDRQGHIVSAIDQNQLKQYAVTWTHCPTWEENEEALYFLGGNDANQRSIFKYTLSTHTLSEYKSLAFELEAGIPADPFVLSPDQTAAAFYFMHSIEFSEIAVLLPNGEIIRLNDPYSWGVHPIWMPPQME
jgi:hypothetical protein